MISGECYYLRVKKSSKKSPGADRKRDKWHLSKKSLGGLAQVYYVKGQDEAVAILRQTGLTSKEDLFFQALRPEDGRPVSRTEEGVSSTVRYWAYDPPTSWESHYQIMRVEVDSKHPTEYLSHTGEEYLLPYQGPGVEYGFLWAEMGKGKLPGEIKEIVKCGCPIRITAEVPHTAKGAGTGVTSAWMITRSIQESAPSIYRIRDKSETEEEAFESSPRKEAPDSKELSDPSVFALRAWGIAEQIKLQRAKLNLLRKDVEERIGIDASLFSKIEEAKKNANPSLNDLTQIAELFDLDVADLISPPVRHCWISPSIRFNKRTDEAGRRPIFEKGPTRKHPIDRSEEGPSTLSIEKPLNDHFVHLQRWCFPENTEWTFKDEPQKLELGDLRWPSSWIVFEGRADIEIEFGSKKVLAPVVSKSVLHVRGGGPQITKIKAIENTIIVQVNYSRDPAKCNCKAPDETDAN